jgi:hypothetical protein
MATVSERIRLHAKKHGSANGENEQVQALVLAKKLIVQQKRKNISKKGRQYY